MEASKVFVFTLFLPLVLTAVRVCAQDSITDVQDELRSDGQDLGVLVEQLKSKIHNLEYHVEEKTRELKDKDAMIAAKEMIIKENSNSIESLEGEIASLKEKGNSDSVEQVTEARARAGDLEKQVGKLNKDIDMQIKEEKQLEKKAPELNSKADIVLSAWFPPWLAARLIYYQAIVEMNWKVNGKPALELVMHKTIEKKAIAEEGFAHVVKTKWAPTIKEKWVVITSNAKPLLQAVTTKTSEIYAASKNVVTSQFIKVVELVVPYFQELRRKEKWAVMTRNAKPHLQALAAKISEICEAAKNVLTLHFIKVVELVDPYFQELRRKGKWVVRTSHAKPHLQAITAKTSEIYEASKNELKRKEKWIVITRNIKPHLQALTTKASEIYEAAKNALTLHFIKVVELVHPYFQKLGRKLKWVVITRNAKPHLQALATKSSQIYEAAKNALTLHFIRFVELVDPYFQELRRFGKSCWSMWMGRNR